MPSKAKVCKCFKATRHCDGSGLALFGVALPPAQAGYDPSGPRQGRGGVRVLLLFGLAFQGWGQVLENLDFRLAKGDGGGARGQPFPRLDQLHHPDHYTGACWTAWPRTRRNPAGAGCAWSPPTHADCWEMPDSFQLERFLPDQFKPKYRLAFMPFGARYRLRVSNTFALTESLLLLAMIAKYYRFDIPLGVTVEPETEVTLRTKGGMRLAVSLW